MAGRPTPCPDRGETVAACDGEIAAFTPIATARTPAAFAFKPQGSSRETDHMKPSDLPRAIVVAALLAVPFAASAQGTAPADAAHQPTASQPNAGQTGRREVYVERRIADLHSRLHITDAQASTWDQFAQVMRDNARNMDQTFEQRAKRVGEMSAVDNMQSYAQVAQEHAQDVQKLVAAFQPLYDAMSPDQKRTADQLFRNYTERAQQRGLGHRG